MGLEEEISLEEIENSAFIDELIRRGYSFALYRIPGETAPHFLMQSNRDASVTDGFEKLDRQKGFVIAPFRVSAECPVVLIRPDLFSLDDARAWLNGEASSSDDALQVVDDASLKDPVDHPLKTDNSSSKDMSSVSDTNYLENYTHCFDLFIDALHNGKYDKLVLSRKQEKTLQADFSPATAFYKACKQYIYSYVYLCHTPQTGLWLGSTPEIILSGEKGAWHTVALAGTQSVQNGQLPQKWDEKNRKEQAYVSSYIREQLLSLDICPQEQGPYPVFAGALSHLRTDFRFTLPDSNGLGSLLHLLHPTPAVCGLPKAEAYQFILENEGYDRRYYSGFIGWLDPDGKTDLYVNLRCMNITDGASVLYAGGGLLSSSVLEDEWLETEKKFQTMNRLLSSFLLS